MRRRLLLLFFVAMALRLAYCQATVGLGRYRTERYQEYALIAARFQTCGTFTCPLILDDSTTAPSAMLPPLYASVLAGIYSLLGVNSFASVFVAQVLNAAALAFSAVVAFDLGRRLSGTRAGWTAATIVAFSPVLIGYVTFLWDTSLFALGVLSAVWTSVWLGDRPAAGWAWLTFGLYLGLLAHLNPALTLAYPLLVLWPLSRQYVRPARLVRGVMLTIAGWAIATTPWTLRNHAHFGEWMYVRGGLGLDLWLGSCPEAGVGGAAVFPTRYPMLNEEVQRHLVAVGERAFVTESMAAAVAAIQEDPWRWLRLIGLRVSDYWLGTTYTHSAPGGGAWPTGAARRAAAWFLCAETILLLAGIALRWRRPGAWCWLVAVLVFFSVVYCVTHVQVRYRMPAEPVLAIAIGLLFFPPRTTAAPAS